MLDNLNRQIEKFYSQFSMHFKRRDKGFRGAHESLCANDGTEGDKTYITLLPSVVRCAVSLLTAYN